jgi:hypothetical protein
VTLYRVKNWRVFQHYKERKPPWIKLQRTLLDDFDFQCLPLASRALAPMLWLLASESKDGDIEGDPKKLAFRLRWPEKEVSAGLTPLIKQGFLISASNVLADPQQEDSEVLSSEDRDRGLETEAESAAKPRASKRCPGDWDWKPEALAEIRRECPSIDLVFETRKLRDYEFGRARSDWDAVARNWMREAQSRVRKNGQPPAKRERPPTPAEMAEARRRAVADNASAMEKIGLAGALKGMP